MKKSSKYLYLILLSLFMTACSSEPAEISNIKWSCKKYNIHRVCDIKFTATNTSHFPADSIIRIRAHLRESVMGSDAYRNSVVGDKVIKVVINPGEQRQFKEVLKLKRPMTNIVVTITSKEI